MKSKTKKGNLRGQTQQVFIYIMVILVVGGVLLFGYKSIHKIIGQSCDVDQATFQAELKQLLERNSGYGDVASKMIKSPCGYEKLCFINSTSEGIDMDALRNENQIMWQEITAGTGNNIFLVKGSTTIPLQGVDFIVVPGNSTARGFTCIPSRSNSFYVVLEGIGKGKVKVSPEN